MKKFLYKCMLLPTKWLWRITGKMHRKAGKLLIHVHSTYHNKLNDQ